MSCSTAVTTNWTPSTSQVTATATTVLTSITTPQASISTRLITTCISTRRSTARSLPTTGNGLSLPVTPKAEGDGSKIDDLTVAATKSQLADDNDNNRRRHRSTTSTSTSTSTSTGTGNKSISNASDESPEEVGKRQISVPAGLPENCVRWTVIPSLSTLAVTPSTSFKTTTTLSSSLTTIWQAKETVFSDCPTTTTTPTSSSTTAVSTSSSVTSESTLAATTTGDAPSSSSSGTWVDELSRFSNLSAVSQTSSSISESVTSGLVAVQTINANTTDTAIPVIPGLVVPSSATTQNPTTPGNSNQSRVSSSFTSTTTTNAGIGAGSGAATQAEAASSQEGSSKAVSAGAAIGGIIGVFLLLGAAMFVLRWWMRRKRGNARKTILMRQSWYPPGYDGPDHIVDTPPPQEKPSMFGRRDRSQSFFSMSGQGPGNITPNDTSKDLPSAPGSGRRFPGLTMPRIVIPFLKRSSTSAFDQEILDDDKVATPDMFRSSDSITRPSSGTGTGTGTRSKIFPGLNAPWSHSSTNAKTRMKSPIVPAWAEKYQDAVDSPTNFNGSQQAAGQGQGQGVYTTPVTPRQIRDDQDAILTRNILKPHTQYAGGIGIGLGGLMGPPRLNYEPAEGHLSWGLNKSGHATPSPPKRGSRALPALNRPNLEWGHSYAASTKNSNPRHSIMPPPPTGLRSGFVPQIPPSPTEESVYSKRESHRSLTSRASTHNNHKLDEPRQLWHSRFSRDQHAASSSNDHGGGAGADLGRKPSGLSNPALRSAILSRASASIASLGHLSFQSGTTDHSLPPLPECGLRLDFPLPPSPSTRLPTMFFSTPTPRSSMGPGAGNVRAPSSNSTATRPMIPSRPSIKAFVPTNNDGNSSSIFEYAVYTRTSEYTTTGPTGTPGNGAGNGNAATKGAGAGPVAGSSLNVNEPGGRDTIRQTADWYDKPLWVWDGQSGPLPRIPDENQVLDGQPWSQSQGQGRKSVRWDPTDGVAMAL